MLYPSDLENFLRCSHRYYLSRIAGYKPKTSLSVLVGRAFHKAISNDVSYFLKEKKHLTPEALLKTAESCYKAELDQEIGNIELDKTKSLEEQYIEAEKMLNNFIIQYLNIAEANLFVPVKSEESFQLKIEDIELAGRFDILTDKGFVEFKTKKERLPKFYDPCTSLQNNIYLMALKHLKNLRESFYIFVSQKEYRIFKAEYDKSIEDKTMKIIKAIHMAIENNIFIPAPQDEAGSWVCDYCGVRDYCEFVLRKK